jgi:predicted nuclease of predicted toxin-antitoxin system
VRLVADENIWADMTAALREAGHEVFSILENHPGMKDPEVLALAFARKEILLTGDKGFGDRIYKEGLDSAGVLLLRLQRVKPSERNYFVAEALRVHGPHLLNSFAVLEKDNLRLRALP